MTYHLPRRSVAFCILLASSFLSGCSYNLWSEHGPWPVERNEYVQLEAAALEADEVLFLKVIRSHSGTEIYRLEFQRPKFETDKWEYKEPVVLDNNMFPEESTGSVYVMSADEELKGDYFTIRNKAPLLVGLSSVQIEDLAHPCFRLVDSRWPKRGLHIDLSDAPIAWNTPSTVVHVLLTPPAILFDVLFWPFEIVFGLIGIGFGG